jgi:hypothetical protein
MVLTEIEMKLTKEQKAELIEKLGHPYGRVELMCDGYRITLRVERSSQLAYRVVTYVNGEWKGVWFSGTENHPEQKFLNRRERPLAKPSQKAKMEKIMGKRAVAKDPWYSKKLVMFDVSWASGKTAINHLVKVCDSIEILHDEAAA